MGPLFKGQSPFLCQMKASVMIFFVLRLIKISKTKMMCETERPISLKPWDEMPGHNQTQNTWKRGFTIEIH